MIQILYDQRYQAAAWMLPVLFLGSWFSILSSVNESALMGLGKPSYAAAANGLRLGFILVALPLGFAQYGALGAILAFAACDLCRYGPIFRGQLRERFSFGAQDALATFVLVALIGFWQWLRWRAGLGTSFDHLPISWSS